MITLYNQVMLMKSVQNSPLTIQYSESEHFEFIMADVMSDLIAQMEMAF